MISWMLKVMDVLNFSGIIVVVGGGVDVVVE
jgi:hypothetical protein